MSMNIHFEAVRLAFTFVKGKQVDFKDHQSFRDVIQTPTTVTYAILEKPTFDEQLAVYKEWVAHQSKRCWNYEEAVYDNDCEVIGTRICDPGEEHIAKLNDWIAEMEANGFTVTSSMM